MNNSKNISVDFKELRLKLSLSQEGLVRELGMSFARVNRWEIGKSSPSQLAHAQFQRFCEQMVAEGKLQPGSVERGGSDG